MKWILSNYNFDPTWIKEYTEDYFIYDRSESDKWTKDIPLHRIAFVPNIGSDIYDKLSWIISHYDNEQNPLPDIVLLTKSNLFKYITKEEFDLVKDNTTFTPLLTQNHKTYSDENGVVCFYENGIYYERNNFWYLSQHPTRTPSSGAELADLLGIMPWKIGSDYIPFAPGSNYILTKENILQNPKELYKELRSYLEWDRYPGEAMIIERGLFTLFKPKNNEHVTL